MNLQGVWCGVKTLVIHKELLPSVRRIPHLKRAKSMLNHWFLPVDFKLCIFSIMCSILIFIFGFNMYMYC
jgi:hypothetical protein